MISKAKRFVLANILAFGPGGLSVFVFPSLLSSWTWISITILASVFAGIGLLLSVVIPELIEDGLN